MNDGRRDQPTACSPRLRETITTGGLSSFILFVFIYDKTPDKNKTQNKSTMTLDKRYVVRDANHVWTFDFTKLNNEWYLSEV